MTHRLRRFAILSILLAACASARIADEHIRIAEVLALAPGMRVADVGAGDGEWSEELARRVRAPL